MSSSHYRLIFFFFFLIIATIKGSSESFFFHFSRYPYLFLDSRAQYLALHRQVCMRQDKSTCPLHQSRNLLHQENVAYRNSTLIKNSLF